MYPWISSYLRELKSLNQLLPKRAGIPVSAAAT
jgi:hypothetical protein